MCGRCDQQERYCPNGHTQPKRHGDVFRADVIPCDTCGDPTSIRDRLSGYCSICGKYLERQQQSQPLLDDETGRPHRHCRPWGICAQS